LLLLRAQPNAADTRMLHPNSSKIKLNYCRLFSGMLDSGETGLLFKWAAREQFTANRCAATYRTILKPSLHRKLFARSVGKEIVNLTFGPRTDRMWSYKSL
jgi:hypothetical protein